MVAGALWRMCNKVRQLSTFYDFVVVALDCLTSGRARMFARARAAPKSEEKPYDFLFISVACLLLLFMGTNLTSTLWYCLSLDFFEKFFLVKPISLSSRVEWSRAESNLKRQLWLWLLNNKMELFQNDTFILLPGQRMWGNHFNKDYDQKYVVQQQAARSLLVMGL